MIFVEKGVGGIGLEECYFVVFRSDVLCLVEIFFYVERY